MVAKIQRRVVFLILLGAGSFLAWGIRTGHLLPALFMTLVLVSAHAIALAFEFICLSWVEIQGKRPRPAGLFGAWWSETKNTPRIFYWRQPFQATRYPDYLPPSADGRRGVLLVHGLLCNRGFWNPWMTRLQDAGIAYVAVNLEPPFSSIEHYAECINREVRRLTSATGAAPIIAAHSMGGLAVRHWLRAHPLPAAAAHHIVTIGTPHLGTWLARFASTTNARQMAVDNHWLTALNAAGLSCPGHLFTCFYGDCDNVVFPAGNACLPGADNRLIPRTAHVCLAFHDEVFDETLHWLTAQPA